MEALVIHLNRLKKELRSAIKERNALLKKTLKTNKAGKNYGLVWHEADLLEDLIGAINKSIKEFKSTYKYYNP